MSQATLSADASSVRRWNERAVIDAMTGEGSLRVAQVAALTGLTTASSRDVLRSLEAKGWVRAASPEVGGMGRPARTFELCDPPAHTLGVDVGGHSVRAVILGPDGESTRLGRAALPAGDRSLAGVLKTIRALTGDLDPTSIWMSGVALSGVLDGAGTVTRSVALPYLEGFDAHSAFSGEVPGRVLICHDTKAALWAETEIGSAVGVRHVMLVHLGRRPSIALMINGEPYAGQHGTAGDLALSDLIPAWDLADAPAGPESDAVDATLTRAAAGDPDAVDVVRAFFRRITPQLAFAAALVDPELIVLAGALAPVLRGVVGEFEASLGGRLQHVPRVEVSTLDEYSIACGAALLARVRMREILLDDADGVAPLVRSTFWATDPSRGSDGESRGNP